MPRLQILVDTMLDHIEAFLTFHSFAPSDKELFAEQHAIIIQALRDKDEGTLGDTLTANILAGLRLIQDAIAKSRPRPRGVR